jgi:hypothetical protein
MLRKMYLVSPDYVNKNERPTTVAKKSPPKTVHKTRAHVKRRIKQPPHPYDKLIAVRGKIAEAAVERKALIKAIGNFIKEVLPNATLVNTMKRESVEIGTQTVPDYTTPPPSYETPISTRIEGPPIATSSLPPYETSNSGTRFEATADDEVGGVSEEDVHTFATKSFGAVPSPYLSPFVNRLRDHDIDYGLSKERDKFFIGNSDVTVDANSYLYIKNNRFIGTPVL